MANRPVFISDGEAYVKAVYTSFEYYNGFSKVRRQRSISSLHSAFLAEHDGFRILEVSSFSDNDLGVALSAFNLKISLKNGKKVPVELAFQAGKTFENGGPYKDLLMTSPGNAKRDARLSESGRITGFEFEGTVYPVEPQTLFYTWLYITALEENKQLADQLMEYNSFTDIVFNPKRSVNCQAYACAVYVSLKKKGETKKAVEDIGFLADIIRKAQGMKGKGFRPDGTAPVAKSASAKAETSFRTIFKKYDMIEHPQYGRGVIKKIIKGTTHALLIVKFDGLPEKKQLMESWVREHCKYFNDSDPTASAYEKIKIGDDRGDRSGFEHYQSVSCPMNTEMISTLQQAEAIIDPCVSLAVLSEHVMMTVFPGEAADPASIVKLVLQQEQQILGKHPDFETATAGEAYGMVVMGGRFFCLVPLEKGQEELSFEEAYVYRQEMLNAYSEKIVYGIAIGKK